MEMRRFAFPVLKYLIVCLLLALLLVLLYLTVRGFPDSVTRSLADRISFGQYAFTIDKLKLNLLEGIIATDVKCFQKGKIGPPILAAGKVVFHFNPVGWWKDNELLFGAGVKQATATVIVGGGSNTEDTPQLIVFKNVNAALSLDRAGKISVNDFTTELFDVIIRGRGMVLPSKKDAVETGPPVVGVMDEAKRETALSLFAKFFKQIKFEHPLSIDVEFVADAGDIANIDVKVKANAGGVSFREDSVRLFTISARFKGVESEVFLEIEDMIFQEINIEHLQTWFTLSSGVLSFRLLNAVIGENGQKGPVEFTGSYEPATRLYKGYARSECDPRAVVDALLKFGFDDQANALSDFDFEDDMPRGSGMLAGRVNPDAWFKMIGFGQMVNASYRDVPVLSAKSALFFHFHDSISLMATMPIFVEREEGSASGDVLMDYERQAIDFNCESSMHPHAVAKVIGPFISDIVEQFRFEGPVHIEGSGTASYGDIAANDIEITATGRNAGALMFLAEECSANLRVVGETIDADVNGVIYGGPFAASASIYKAAGYTNNMYYEIAGEVRDAAFEQILAALGQKRNDVRGGEVSAKVLIRGFAGQGMGPTVTGKGRISVSEGRVFQIPLFGGLSDILTKYVPGLGAVLSQTDAKASFTVADSKVSSRDIAVEGDVFSLTAEGDYYFNDQLDFRVQVALMRSHTAVSKYLVRPITKLITKALEIRLTGVITDPEWYSAYAPREWLFK